MATVRWTAISLNPTDLIRLKIWELYRMLRDWLDRPRGFCSKSAIIDGYFEQSGIMSTDPKHPRAVELLCLRLRHLAEV